MASGCGMNLLSEKMPERFYDVGIEEEHAVTFAAGLAAGGLKPFCNIYSSFSHRAYDQIFHDVALQGLPVVLCLDRGGIVGEDGATHRGCYDMSVFRAIPGAIIAAPKDEIELKDMMYSAMLCESGPYIIRYPRGYGEGCDWVSHKAERLQEGKAELLLPGSEIAVIAAGPMAYRAVEAAKEIQSEEGWTPSVYNIRYIKPLDKELVTEVAANHRCIITVEEGSVIGGLYGAVAELMSSSASPVHVRAMAIPDLYLSQGTQSELREECGLSKQGIKDVLLEEMKKNRKKIQKVLEI